MFEAVCDRGHSNSILFCSGLIAGEAIMGVVLAALVLGGMSFQIFPEPIVALGVIFFLGVALYLWWLGRQEIDKGLGEGEVVEAEVVEEE